MPSRMHKGYEEITVPAVKPSSMGENEALVAINALPEWAQSAFQGYKYDLYIHVGCRLTLHARLGTCRP